MATPATVDTILRIRVDQIIPDPTQPRFQWDTPDAKADLEALGDSLQSEGQLEPITVMPDPAGTDLYMLEDGERRWRAAQLRGIRELDAILTMPDRLLDGTERLLAQLAHNTGRPLTPLEKARAFQRLVDDGISQADIAKRTGTPRSTVGDYVRMAQLPKAWLDELDAGKLQPSHAPALSPWSKLPEELHEKAVKNVKASWEWKHAGDERPISVERFKQLVQSAYAEFLCPLSELNPGYDGVVIECRRNWQDTKPRKYAAEPAKWRALKKPEPPPKPLRGQPGYKPSEAVLKARKEEKARQEREKKARAKRQAQRTAQFVAVVDRLPALGRDEHADWWLFIARALLEDFMFDDAEPVAKGLGLEARKGKYGGQDWSAPLLEHVAALDAAGRSRVVLQVLLAPDANVALYRKDEPRRLERAAELLGLDLSAIKADEPAPAASGTGTKWERRNKRGQARRQQAAAKQEVHNPQLPYELCGFCTEPLATPEDAARGTHEECQNDDLWDAEEEDADASAPRAAVAESMGLEGAAFEAFVQGDEDLGDA